jgi:hypothetical protein
MSPLLPLRARNQQRKRSAPALDPLSWVDGLQLSTDELAMLREHIERSLQLDEECGGSW